MQKAMVGVNIGGWMVLEPWITPSLFYRFLGNKHSDGVGRDSSSFCDALGPEEGNRVMRAHWKSWVTEAHIKELKEKEGIGSIDDILRQVVKPDGMSFNGIEPVYRELLMKLAMSMSKDEIFIRSQNIMNEEKGVN